MNLRTFRIGGVHPEENKITAEMATQVAPLPKQAMTRTQVTTIRTNGNI
jgi:Na+-translocating ferredoxin:NAD+ oxidoreductase subunit C